MTKDIQAALEALNVITDLSRSEGTFMEFMASHEGTLRALLEKELATPAPTGKAVELLEMMYDKYENGDNVTENGEADGAHLGSAIKLSQEEEDAILEVIPRYPKGHPSRIITKEKETP